MLLTEYYNQLPTPKTGFLRSFLRGDFTESQRADEEQVFMGYDLVFTAAYYPTSTMVFAMAVSPQHNSLNYLIHYDWSAPG